MSYRTYVQQPHALAWEFSDDALQPAIVGDPRLWEDTEEPAHSNFASVTSGTGALMHQCTQPGNISDSNELPTEGTVDSPACIELKTLEMHHPASHTASTRKRGLEPQLLKSTAGGSQQPESELKGMKTRAIDPLAEPAFIDIPLQSMASLTISPRKRAVEQAPVTMATRCLQPFPENWSRRGSVRGALDFAECIGPQPLLHMESLSVGPGRRNVQQHRPVSVGRYADAESITSTLMRDEYTASAQADVVHSAGRQQSESITACGWATSTQRVPYAAGQESPEQEVEKDPYAGNQKHVPSRTPACGVAGPGRSVRACHSVEEFTCVSSIPAQLSAGLLCWSFNLWKRSEKPLEQGIQVHL
jgi:hypothetical protein